MRKNDKKVLTVICMVIAFLTIIVTTVNATISNSTNCSIPTQVSQEDNPILTQMYRIYIENFANGVISKVDNNGVHYVMGHVLKAAQSVKISDDGFWAAHYDKAQDGTHSCVTAAGVNAVHIRVGPNMAYDPLNPTQWRPYVFDLGIKEDYDHSGGVYSNSMIYTDIPGGSGVFGGWNAPMVGSPVKFYDTDSTWKSLDIYFNGDYTKPLPKRLMIVVNKPSTSNGSPDYIEFENWAAGDTVAGVYKDNNGHVTIHYLNGTTKYIADMIQRVSGTGRFIGSEYADVGRLRANHPGVICFSTSPKVGYTSDSNLRGGFQIVPANHAKYLNYNLNQDSFIGKAQWGIVAYVGANKALLYDSNYLYNGSISYNPIWEGIAPLFGQYLRPKNIPGDLTNSTYFKVSTDFGATWQDCPTIQGVTDATTGSPVNNWTNIRIYISY